MNATRYITLPIFLVSLVVPVGLLEALFVMSGSGLSVRDSRGVGQVSLYLVLIASATAFSLLVARDRIGDFFLPYLYRPARAGAGFAAMWALSTCVVIVGYGIFALLGSVDAGDGPSAAEFRPAGRIVLALAIMLVLVATEELLFRAVVMRYLRWNNSAGVTIAAIVASALIFAAAHNVVHPQPWLAPEQIRLFTGLFLLGTLLATTYVATGSLTCAAGLHAGFLGSKIFTRNTHLLDVEAGTWLLGYSGDLRTAPAVWLIFAGLTVAIFLARRRLHARFAIEPVISRPK